MKSDQKSPVTLEVLLRLKRAERPPAEFWPQFERELRAKQLAAIVARRPWWSELPRQIFSNFSKYRLPLGATAVVALTFISLRQYRSAESGRALAASLSAISTTSSNFSVPIEREKAATGPIEAVSAPVLAGVNSSPSQAATEVVANESPASVRESRTLSGEVSAMNALLGVSNSSDRDRSIASGESFASLSVETPFTPPALGEKRGFESRGLPNRNIDPLAHVTPPDRVRASRYLPANALPAALPVRASSSRSSERLVSRVSDRLYETDSRLGFGGNQVAFKW